MRKRNDKLILAALHSRAWRVDIRRGVIFGVSGRPLKTTIRNGYASVSIPGTGDRKAYVHRVIYLAEHGRIPRGKTITHLLPPDTDNRIKNLAVGRKKSLSKPRMKLSAVRKIRRYKRLTTIEIGRRFKISQAQVSLIRRNLVWKEAA